MSTLLEIQEAADHLTLEEREGLIAHLLAGMPSAPIGADDEEANRRDIEMDSGKVKPLSHAEFLAEIDRR
ncbi:hypothetical protein [Roseimicrobium sp. ORNL1]|uniref:hypothetical protein n=1 Tax=Roseimicrobium sp. ORNL1 TaxID=2711231 RepID=UPI0013E12CBA|nr:hypothetical protein [Roseimicrobium sp. ORNL1]QIF04819.1 hypothetical protein G5S37_25990 [Roseimicrobium sp. ORNL1]